MILLDTNVLISLAYWWDRERDVRIPLATRLSARPIFIGAMLGSGGRSRQRRGRFRTTSRRSAPCPRPKSLEDERKLRSMGYLEGTSFPDGYPSARGV